MRIVTQDRFGGPNVLHTAEADRPEPLPTEVRVRVHAAGINPVDLKTRGGEGMAGVLGDPPFVLGWDVAGTVDAVGFGVTVLREGDRVLGMPWFPRQAGAYAEYVTAPARQFALLPDGIEFDAGASVPLAALTAWQTVVDTARVAAGQRVLVHGGAGGVGRFAVQFAAMHGASVAVTASAADAEAVRALGAATVVDYRTQRFDDELSDLDVVVDLIGTEDYGLRSVSVLRPGGLYIGVPDGVGDAVAAAAAKRDVRTSDFLVEPDGPALTTIAGLIADGKVRLDPVTTYPLADAARAHADLESRAVSGKVVLTTG